MSYLTYYNIYAFHRYVDKYSIIAVVAYDKDSAIENIIRQMDKGEIPSLRIFDCRAASDPIPANMALVVLS